MVGLTHRGHITPKRKSRVCHTGGHLVGEAFRTLKATYYRAALDLIEQYRADALFNGLKINRDEEEKCVEVLSEVIISAGQHYLDNPLESLFIPSWQRVESAMGDIFEHLSSAVEDDLNDTEIGKG
ncbi:hypothetical protein [uncultured Thalassospira sp.]|uniref:hypothetical protein n=1 Tax=uncultured Thalassospira sp. TaxID=404382 RepID=UPI00258ADC2C|nr:hypothetical protein [uncultured Thalassospira sp.]